MTKTKKTKAKIELQSIKKLKDQQGYKVVVHAKMKEAADRLVAWTQKLAPALKILKIEEFDD